MTPGVSAAGAAFASLEPSGSLLDGLTLSDPLPAGRLALAVLPNVVDVALIKVDDPRRFVRDVEAEGWATTRMGLGFARIDMDGYRLTIDDIRAELVVDNLLSGESARLWGDGNFDAGEESVGRFWGTTSLQLADGLFITCGTAAVADNPNLYRLDRLTITKGSDAIVISAIGGEADDMALTGASEAWLMEEDTADGLVMVEGEGGWLTEAGDAADAAYLEQTAPGGEYGPDEFAWSGREFGRIMTRYVDAVVQHGSSQSAWRAPDIVADSRRHDDDHAALVRAEHRRAALASALLHGSFAGR